MKFNCGPSLYQRWENRRDRQYQEILNDLIKYQDWQDHYAWWPTRVGPNDCRWLETVQIKDGRRTNFSPEYRARHIVYHAHRAVLLPIWEYRAKENN